MHHGNLICSEAAGRWRRALRVFMNRDWGAYLHGPSTQNFSLIALAGPQFTLFFFYWCVRGSQNTRPSNSPTATTNIPSHRSVWGNLLIPLWTCLLMLGFFWGWGFLFFLSQPNDRIHLKNRPFVTESAVILQSDDFQWRVMKEMRLRHKGKLRVQKHPPLSYCRGSQIAK